MNITYRIVLSFTTSLGLFLAGQTFAAESSKKEARVTQIIRDVKLLPTESAPRAASVNDKVAEDTGVRTGGDSRSELTFPDLTITRLGSNTIFSFSKAGRTAKVDSGSILLRVPKDSGGGTVKTSAVTVAVTGTTLIFESGRGGKSKLITLEGGSRMALVSKPKDFRYVKAGQMLDVPAGATTLPNPVNIDLNQVMKNHPLITDFPPLPSRDLIYQAAQQPPPPSNQGPVITIVPPIIDILGGFTGGTRHRDPRQPPRQPPTNSDHNTDNGPVTNQSPTKPPGTTRSPGATKSPGPTQPPIITRTVPTTTPVQKYKPKPTSSPSGPR
ncbi:MAG: hypothetical protein V7609_1217 [Verrucomicrobiota bacterium]